MIIYSSLPKLKAVCFASTGYNSANIESASKYNKIITNVPDYCKEEVANHAISILLLLHRKLLTMKNYVLENNWDCNAIVPITRLSLQTVGIFGIGRIGKEFAKRIQAFNTRVIAYDPNVNQSEIDALNLNVDMVDFETLIKESDYISIHASLNESNDQIFNKETFKSMKDTCVLINTARGQLLNQDDLIDALNNDEIAGAGLDVLENEPPTKKENPLLKMDNVYISAHCGFYSQEAEYGQLNITISDIILILNGKKPINQI